MIRVIDDVVSQTVAQQIEDYALSNAVKWELERATMPSNFVVKDPNIVEFLQFRSIIKHGERIFDKKSHDFVDIIFQNLLRNFGVMVEDCFRIKYNLLPKIEKLKDLQYNTPHVDASIPHYGIIYYVTDSDGDTIIFDQSKKEHPMEDAHLFQEFTIKETVSPKRGRLLIFDGNLYHTSSHPLKNDLRCVINMNAPKKMVRML